MKYLLRYSFDPGSGVCLWAGDDASRERFDYAVEHWELPLSENAKRFLQHLVAWFDTSIDWSSPGDTDDYWSSDELARFKEASAKGLRILREELSPIGYEFSDETGA